MLKIKYHRDLICKTNAIMLKALKHFMIMEFQKLIYLKQLNDKESNNKPIKLLAGNYLNSMYFHN